MLSPLFSAVLLFYGVSDGHLSDIGNTHTDLPTASPAPSPAPSPVPSALPTIPVTVTAIQNEGLACMAMAASLPGLQTLTGKCIRCEYFIDDCVLCLASAVMRGHQHQLAICVPLDDMHPTICELII